jgi:hypothetical protein
MDYTKARKRSSFLDLEAELTNSLTVDQETFVKNFIKKIINGWGNLRTQDIKLKRLAGLTIIVFLAELLLPGYTEGCPAKPKHVVVKMAEKNAIIDNNLNPYYKEVQAWLVQKKRPIYNLPG